MTPFPVPRHSPGTVAGPRATFLPKTFRAEVTEAFPRPPDGAWSKGRGAGPRAAVCPRSASQIGRSEIASACDPLQVQ